MEQNFIKCVKKDIKIIAWLGIIHYNCIEIQIRAGFFIYPIRNFPFNLSKITLDKPGKSSLFIVQVQH